MSFYAVFQNWIFKVECHVGEKLSVSGPQTWLSIVLKQIDCYHFAFLAVHFCHPTTCYPLQYWELLYVYMVSARPSSHPSVCSALRLLPNCLQGKKKRKILLYLKHAELWEAFEAAFKNPRTNYSILQWLDWKTWRSHLFKIKRT